MQAQGVAGARVQLMGDLKAINTKSESLKKLSGDSADFKSWSEHMMDHMAKVYPAALKYLSKTDENLSGNRLRMDTMGPYSTNSWDLAEV